MVNLRFTINYFIKLDNNNNSVPVIIKNVAQANFLLSEESIKGIGFLLSAIDSNETKKISLIDIIISPIEY